MDNIVCSEKECAPPFGEKEDCEFYRDGACIVQRLDPALVRILNKEPKKKRVKLKPCPKCGSNKKSTLPVKCFFETHYKVRCSICGFETDNFESKDEAHTTWNDC